MRITFVAPAPDLSGGIQVIARHAAGLAERGHSVTVVAPRPPVASRRDRVVGWLRGRPPEAPIKHTPFDDLGDSVVWIDRVRPVTDGDLPDADAVVATWWETAFAVAALSPRKGRKFHFVQGHETHLPATAHLAAGSYHLPLRKIAISGWLSDILRDSYGCTEVDLVPNAVDHVRFHAPPRDRRNPPCLGFVYGRSPGKGADLAHKAVARLRERFPDLAVVAFGSGSEDPALPLPPGARFLLRPDAEAIRRLYASCDVWMMPSRSEGFALPILEAMACRTPVVSARTGCAADLIEPGVNGALAEIGDAEGLARGAAEVLSLGAPAWRAMSEAAQAAVAATSWAASTARLEAALQAGIAAPQGPRG